MTQKEAKSTFLALINNSTVHRVDLTRDGQKNNSDYGYGLAHYSVGSSFKAEVKYTNKDEDIICKVIIKNKTFNTIVAEFTEPDYMGALVHALESRTMATRMFGTKNQQLHAELSKLANVR